MRPGRSSVRSHPAHWPLEATADAGTLLGRPRAAAPSGAAGALLREGVRFPGLASPASPKPQEPPGEARRHFTGRYNSTPRKISPWVVRLKGSAGRMRGGEQKQVLPGCSSFVPLVSGLESQSRSTQATSHLLSPPPARIEGRYGTLERQWKM